MKYSFLFEMPKFGAFVATLLLMIFTGCSESSTQAEDQVGKNLGPNAYMLCSSPFETPSSLGQFEFVNVDYPTENMINGFTAINEEHRVSKYYIYMREAFADSSLRVLNRPDVPSFVVIRGGLAGSQVFGFYNSYFAYPYDKGSLGQRYEFEGYLRDLYGNVVEGGLLEGDYIALNVPWNDLFEDESNGGDYAADVWAQLMAWSKMMPASSIATSSGKKVTGFDDLKDVFELSESYCRDDKAI